MVGPSRAPLCVIKYIKKASKEKGGRIIANNGYFQMTVLWEDAPADKTIRGKSIIGLTLDITLEEFEAAYTVHRREMANICFRKSRFSKSVTKSEK